MSVVIENKQKIVLGSLVVLSLLESGCKFNGSSGKDGGDGDSLVAAIGGISDEDLARNPVYKLVCKDPQGGDRANLIGAVENKTKITFKNAAAVVPNDKCSFEVNLPDATKAPYNTWQWFAFNDNKPVVGLMYGSEIAAVTSDRKLVIKVLKVYGEPATDESFKALVKFTLPKDEKETLAASLKCEGNLSASGKVSSAGETGANRTAEFDLDKKFIGKKCTELSILAGSVSKYTKTGITDIDFKGATAKDALTFPPNFNTGGSRYVFVTSPNGELVTQFVDGGECKKFDASKMVCLEKNPPVVPDKKPGSVTPVASKKQPTQNIMMKVSATKDGKATFVYVTGAAFGGISPLPQGTAVDVAEIAKGAAATKAPYHYYSDFLFGAAFTKTPLTNAMRDGTDATLKAKKLKAEDLKGIKFNKVEQYWLHGFKTLQAKTDLDRIAQPTWFAMVTMKKDAETRTLMVTGPFDGFMSKDKVSSKGVYFDWSELLSQAKEKTFKNWRVYALSETSATKFAANPSECNKKIVSLQTMVDVIGKKTKEDFTLVSRDFAVCLVKADQPEVFSDDWKLTSTQFYHWTWYDGN